MPKFKFHKLVRDKIADSQLASGARPKFHILTDREHKRELVKKIIEEAQEITQAPDDEVALEIADVQQALDDLRDKFGLTAADISKAQAAKDAKSGAFKKGIFIEYVEVDEDYSWIDHFRKNPDRYPEM